MPTDFRTHQAIAAYENAARLIPHAVDRIRESLVWLEGFEGASRKFHLLATVPDEQALLDLFAEIKYVQVFDRLGFQVTLEPLGELKGPDLRIARDGGFAFVEVTRFRPINPGPPPISAKELGGPFLLEEYGTPQRDIIKAFRRIRNKFAQLGNERGLIAIWNDDGDLEELEVEQAVREIRSDPAKAEWTQNGQGFSCLRLQLGGGE